MAVFSAGDLDAVVAGFAAALGAMPFAAEPDAADAAGFAAADFAGFAAVDAAGEADAADAAGFVAALGVMPCLVAAPAARAAAVFHGELYQGNAHMAFIRRAGPNRNTSILDQTYPRLLLAKWWCRHV
jgi:hypothetical protein